MGIIPHITVVKTISFRYAITSIAEKPLSFNNSTLFEKRAGAFLNPDQTVKPWDERVWLARTWSKGRVLKSSTRARLNEKERPLVKNTGDTARKKIWVATANAFLAVGS